MIRKTGIVLILLCSICSCVKPTPVPSKDMVLVEGGEFRMGLDGEKWNAPRPVELDSFYMARNLVTVKEWKEFLHDIALPYNWDLEESIAFDGKLKDLMPEEDCPIQGMNWYYAIAYCNWLSERDGFRPCYRFKGKLLDMDSMPDVIWNKKANGYRLPTDAEWEYAARGGQLSKGFLYAGSNDVTEVAKIRQKTSYPVGQMKPNELDLYDMTGNARAWCWDWFDTDPGTVTKRKNPSVDKDSDVQNRDKRNPQPMKVVRGLNWKYPPRTVYGRSHYPPQSVMWIGIRLVRNAD